MNITRNQIITQYKRAKSKTWTEHFREAANTITHGYFDTADLMAIASRETNLDPKWLTKKGDNGHGAGLMQIDDRSFPEFTNSTKWKDARLGILKGAEVLMQKWRDLQKNAGKKLTVKQYSFTGPNVSGITAQQIALAAYNSGRWAAYHYTKGRHPDYGTTGKDYSSDVMARARVFRELLAKDGMLDASASVSTGNTIPPVADVQEQSGQNPLHPTEPLPDSLEVTQTQEVETAEGVESVSVTQKNEQNVNEVVQIVAPPHQGVFKKLTAGVGTLFGGTVVYTVAERIGAMSFSMQSILLIAVVLFIAFLAFAFWMWIDAWKQAQKIKVEAESKTNIYRKDIEWVQK